MEKTPVPFNTVLYVLDSIIMLVVLFIGVHEKIMAPGVGGLLILLFGAAPHTVGFGIAVRQDNTMAATIIGTFCSFWWYVSSMLLALAAGIATKAHYVGGLKVALLGIAIIVFQSAWAYRRARSLLLILLGLGTTVTYLWIADAVVPALEHYSSWVVGALGVGSIIVRNMQMYSNDQKQSGH